MQNIELSAAEQLEYLEKYDHPRHWFLLPGGGRAISRYSLAFQVPGTRLATPDELRLACLGYPLVCGSSPDPAARSSVWNTHRVGVGGLFHQKWFICADNLRYGGADNIACDINGQMRRDLRVGTARQFQSLEVNEGYATVRDLCGPCLPEHQYLYQLAQNYNLRHVTPDGGELIISMIEQTEAGPTVYICFGGRCNGCAKLEQVSFPAARAYFAEHGYTAVLQEEYKRWNVHLGGVQPEALVTVSA